MERAGSDAHGKGNVTSKVTAVLAASSTRGSLRWAVILLLRLTVLVPALVRYDCLGRCISGTVRFIHITIITTTIVMVGVAILDVLSTS